MRGECLNDADGDGVCDELEIVGCMQLEACNWNEDATEPDDSCEFPGDACDDGDDTTINDVITADCDCVGEVDRVDEFTQWGIALFPTPVQDVMHLQFRGRPKGGVFGHPERRRPNHPHRPNPRMPPWTSAPSLVGCTSCPSRALGVRPRAGSS